MNICLFNEDEISRPLDLRDERGEHIVKILHKKEGETFTAGIIGGQAGTATIIKIEGSFKEGGRLFFDFKPEADGKPLTKLKMIIGFPRPIQLKRLLRDIAGLGVCEVHLTGTELGEKSYMQSTLVEKGAAYKMLLDGTVQAGSTHVPELFLHKSLDECVAKILEEDRSAPDQPSPLLAALDNRRPVCSLGQLMEGAESHPFVVAAIGSERGWTDRERDFLEEKGFTLCGMGERILRTETAATVAGSIILSQLGII
ncbi:RsmE family RNA methyltransferase [Treponema sp. C6A8]|uniref:RsmE family RNA methyltransferase n=1 Tax=Treponema sp. C6A8 TaxID=1410609 RepID=UPI0004898A0C|nr:RsmE family RNA methyltransferase [Treponema sp. C6A8]